MSTTETEPTTGRRKLLWWGGGIIAAVALVAVVLSLAGGSPDAAPAPTTTVTTTPGTDGIRVASGTGGKQKAPDGITPVGYESTCAGAVQAAANYDTALTDPTGTTGYNTPTAKTGAARPGLDATLNRILSGSHPSIIEAEEGARPSTLFPGQETHPEWGGFKVVRCTPSSLAVIDLFSCSVIPNRVEAERFGVAGLAMCVPARYQLRWGGAPFDWRLHAREGSNVIDPQPFNSPDGEPVPITAKRRAEILKPGGTGWTEFTNAPK